MIRPAMSSAYFIAGRRLLVQALDEWSARVADNFLRDFHLQPISIAAFAPSLEDDRACLTTGDAHPASPEVSYTIRLRSELAAPPIPIGLETFEVAFGHCHVDGTTYYLDVDESLVVVGAEGKRLVDVWIGESARARKSLSLINVLSYALEAALRRCGLYQLHGAGVSPTGQSAAALILGESGSGKSTLASVLASRGWRYLTDDALLVTLESEVVIARGMRRFFAASETTLKASSIYDLRHVVGSPMVSDPTKLRVEPNAAFPERFIESCTPRILCFASVTREVKSHVTSLSRSEAMTRMIRSNPWASYDVSTAHDHLKLLNRLVNQCRAYKLESGLDILSEPDCAESLIGPLLMDELFFR